METYRFAALGTETFVGGMRMNRFGQRFQIDEKLAAQAQRGGAVLLKESEFKSFGFTDADLKVWGSPFMSQHDVPAKPEDAKDKAAFLAKVAKAQARFIEIQRSLLEPHERTTPFVAAVAPVLIEESDDEPLSASKVDWAVSQEVKYE